MSRDRYESLCRFYEFMLGPLPWREELRRTLQETASAEDLAVFFLVPFSGAISLDRVARKAHRPAAELAAALGRLADEGFLLAYTAAGEPVYERANPVFMTEQQVRKAEDTPRRAFYARFFNAILEGKVSVAFPNRTPYYRVLPVESTLRSRPEAAERGCRVIPINIEIPDPRAVLPVDIVSEMIRRDADLIGVADCYCRRTKQLVGEGCGHPLQTCLVFNKGAESLITHGTARRIDYNEAMAIVWMAEEAGLVHNVDNCEGEIGSVCNCCPCCCILLRSWQRGMANAGGPSRYSVAYEPARCQMCAACVRICPTGARTLGDGRILIDDTMCLGCGLCVTACEAAANRMVPRATTPRLLPTAQALMSQISREAVVGLTLDKVRGLLHRA